MGPGAGIADHPASEEGAFSPEITRLVNGIHAGRVVHVRVSGEEHRYLFRPTRITAKGFKISAGVNAEHPAAFEVFEGQQILADGTLTGMAKLAVVNHTLSMAYATEAGDFLIEESKDGKWVARTLLSAEKGSTWGHFKCDEANGLAGIVDASGDSPEPPRQEVEIMLASEAESSTTPQVEGARVSHPYFRPGSQYDASLKDILVLMVSSKSQTGTNLSSKAATYFTYAATTADVYERQLGLRYLLQELVLIPSNSAEADIEPAVNNPNDNGSDDLSTLRTWCETHRPQATYGWGHAMGWTLVEGSGGGWIGWAWVDSYGSSTFAYSVNEPEWTWGVHVHELGHNVGASHTTGSGGAMNPSVSKSNPQEGFFTQSEGGSYTAATDIYNYMSSSSRNYVFGPAPLRNPVEMPFGVDDAVATNANTPVTFNPLSNDLATTPLFGQTNTLLRLVEAGQVFPKAAGTARISGNQITFTPASGFTGNAWLTYTLRGNMGNGGGGWMHSADVVVIVGGSSSDPGQNPAVSTTNDVIEADLTGPVRINPLLNDEGKGRLWAGGVDAVSSINGTAQSYSDAAFHLVSAQVITGNGSVSLETASMTRNSTNSQGHTGYLVYTPGANEPDLIEIQYTAQDADGNQSTGTIFFRKVDPREIKATGTVIGTTGSYLNNPAWDKNKAFDGDLGTFYDAANANGDWAGLDLGTARQITRIRFAPRSTWPSRMVGGQFQGSNVANFSTGVVTLHTVAGSPTTGVLTNVLVNNTGTYRYLRYIGPDGGFCNVAEVEFYTEAAPAAPAGLAATVQGNGSVSLDWVDNAESDLHSYRVYRSTISGNFGDPLATNVPGSSYNDSTAVNGTTYYYTVTAVDQEGYESGWSNQQSATPTGGLLVSAGPGGLVYETYANEGQANKVNTVPDFSRAGYKGGGVEIPFVPAAITLSDDGAADDTTRIQNAINTVSALPLVGGFRGAVLLQAGNYTVSSTLNINASGVVIRGAGQQATGGTTITYTATTQSDLFLFSGNSGPAYVGSSARAITDAYVPVGAKKLHVTNASPFAPGDMIRITNLVNQQWIDDIGMTEAGGLGGGTEDPAWDPAGFQLHHYRYVVAVNGTELTLDAPIVQAIETQYGGGEVRKYTYTGAIENVGIENIRLESTYASENDEAHGWEAIEMRKVRNGWVRQVTSRYFGMGLVLVQDNSLFVTVEDSACLDPKSITTGGRKYSFNVDDSTYNLVQRCLTRRGRHDFVSGSLTHGPNAFVDGLSTQTNSDSGPHFRYATGQIYDNIKSDNEINVQNRLNSGTSHGWSGAQILFWNIDADGIICDAPTGAMNWAIGAVGTKQEGSWVPTEPFGIWQSENAPVAPRSLYYAQLEDRLGTEALRNVVLPQQEAGRIWTEMQAWSGDGRFLDGVVCWIDDSAPVEVLTPVSIRARIRDLGILENLSSTTWNKLSGPGNVTFGNAANLVTTVQFDRLGTYEIRSTANDGSRQVSGSFTVVVTDPNELGPPAAPSGLVATPGEESVSLDWNNNGESDLDFYRVYRSETPGSYGTALATTVTGSTYTDNTAVGGTTYYYVVTAVDTDNKESVFSNQVNATPTEANQPPAFDSNPLVKANAEANTAYSSSVADDASDPNPDTLSFSKVSGPAWLTVASNGSLSGTPNSSNLGLNEWTLQVADGQGGTAQTVLRITVNADTTAPNTPSGLTATPGDGQVVLNWNDNSDPDFSSYTIYRATTTGGYTTALASDFTSSQYTDATAVNGTTYYYVVRANDADGNESSNGNEAVATPTAVTEFTVAATDNAYIRASETDIVQNASQSLLVNRSSWTFGSREAFIRIPLSGDNAIGGYPVDSIDSVTLDLFATTIIPGDTVKVYALLDGVQFSGSHLAENTWTGGTAGTLATGGNLTPNNRPDGGGTMPKSGYTTASLGQITFSASPVNGTLQRITISNLTAFKDLIRNDTNGQITLVLVSSTNSPNNAFASVYNTSGHAVPKLSVGLTPPDVTPPAAPTGLTATPGNNSISLDWNDNAEGDLASYAVYRRETGGSYGTALATGLTSSTYVDASAVNGTEYFYVVRAVDTAANVSNASNEGSATPSNDFDGDGLDDAWETEYLGNMNGDGSGDMDGDGTTDFFEYLYGSDPDDNTSRGFHLVAEAGPSVGRVAFRWQVQEQFVLGTHYGVHISTNLTSWDPLPVEHYTLEQTSAGIRTQHELSLTHDYGNKVFIRLSQP